MNTALAEEVTGDRQEEEGESRAKQQELLERRLQEAESSAEESTNAAIEMEGLIADLRQEQVKGQG